MPFPTTARRRSFGTTIMVSTFLRMSVIPLSACFIRRRPSKRNGLVTMPTVSAPVSRAIWATTGAAPVPVPPPMPQVTNTMSALNRHGHFVPVLLDGLAADLGPGAGTEPAGELAPDLDLDVRFRDRQRLRIGVDRDELDAAELVLDHAV